MSSRAKGVMQIRIDGMRVRNVSRMTIVHCAEPPPSPVIRNSFGFEAVVPNRIGAEATGAAVDPWASAAGADPAPMLFCAGDAFADAAAKEIIRQSITWMIKECFTPAFPLASQPVEQFAVLRARWAASSSLSSAAS